MTWAVLEGDCRDLLPTLPAASVHCVVTSPPYWGLRDYGTGTWAGGEAGCDHKAGSDYGEKSDTNRGSIRGGPFRETCGKCGARRIDQQLGLERTPEAYIANLVAVFRAVRRVMRDDATCWLNLGDSYAAGSCRNGEGASGLKNDGRDEDSRLRSLAIAKTRGMTLPKLDTGLKPKDLVGIPWRVAFALQADGWYLRADIIWAKPNPMPESVEDRPTKAHEYLFLLAKSARYFYDAEAIREPHQGPPPEHYGRTLSAESRDLPEGVRGAFLPVGEPRTYHPAGRNRRSVWTIATAPFPEAHFATFPPALVEPCLLAGTSARGACPVCGAPWRRVVAREFVPQPDVSRERGVKGAPGQKPMDASSGWEGVPRGSTRTETTGWAPSCACDAGDPVPCTVLDPFAGAGTTLLVADRLGRHALGIELSPTYVAMGRRRLTADAPLLNGRPA